MKTRAALLVAVMTLAGGGCQRPPMTEFTSPDGKFKAKFPGKPAEKTESAAGVPFKAYVVEFRDVAYMVGVADVPIPAGEPAALIEQRLDGARDGAVSSVGGTLKGSTPVTLAGKYPGRELTATVTKPAAGQLRARFYLVGSRMYQVMVVGTGSRATGKDASEFLDSFQLLDPPAAKPAVGGTGSPPSGGNSANTASGAMPGWDAPIPR